MIVRRQFCIVMEIRESVKHLLGKKDYSLAREEERELELTGTDCSSLVVDRLCDQARGQNTAVTCFYFDFAERKEQSATSMLGSLVKQMVSGMENIPEDIMGAFQEHERSIGGRRPQHASLVKMLKAIASSRPTFICIDALDECAEGERPKLLDSLNEILKQSPGTRIFVTGRPHIRDQVERRLAGHVASLLVSSTRADITRYLHARLGHDETPDAMDDGLKAEILEKISENISEMYVGAIVLPITFRFSR